MRADADDTREVPCHMSLVVETALDRNCGCWYACPEETPSGLDAQRTSIGRRRHTNLRSKEPDQVECAQIHGQSELKQRGILLPVCLKELTCPRDCRVQWRGTGWISSGDPEDLNHVGTDSQECFRLLKRGAVKLQ